MTGLDETIDIEAPDRGPRQGSGARLAEIAQDPRVRSAIERLALGVVFFAIVYELWEPPRGIWVQGAIIGGLTALIAFGIALIYRTNRIVNFAQADLGYTPAVLAFLLLAGPGVPYFIALPTGIAAAIVLGAVVETLIIRRFFRAPRLILTVATILMSLLLVLPAFVLISIFDIEDLPSKAPAPFDVSISVHPLIFGGNDVIAMLTIPVVIVALAAFFRFTNMGIAVRASAESADRAALLGIPVKRIHTIVWIMATVLATLAMFLRAGVVGIPLGSVLGPSILLRALAAAVVGRMERLPTIFVAAVGLGIIEQSVLWHTGNALLADPILFLVVLGGLLLQRRGEVARADDTGTSTWQASQEVRPIPRELARLPEVRWGLFGLYTAIAVVLVALPAWLPESRINLVAVIVIYGIIGISLVVLTGWAGQVSLGQVAFVGIGAAVAGSITSRLGWDITLAIVVAGLVGAVAAMLIGLPAVRIRGLFLAVTTLAFALATSSFLLSQTYFDWWLPQGRIERQPLFGRVDLSSETRYYYLALVGFALALGAARGVRHSRTGRILIATRENERAAQAFGVNATRAKLTAFAISGFLAAYAGGLFIHHQQSLGINPYLPSESLQVFVMVVIGGLGSIPGVLLGAIYIRGLAFFLPVEFRFFTTGIFALVVLIVLPGGLGSILYGIRDWLLRRLAQRRGIIVPSLLADVRQGAEETPRPPTFAFESAASDNGQGSDGTEPLVAVDPDAPRPSRRRKTTSPQRKRRG